METWQVSEVRFTESVPLWDGDDVRFDYLKYNENHDELGRFAETGQDSIPSGVTTWNPSVSLDAKQRSAIHKYTDKGNVYVNNLLRFGAKPPNRAVADFQITTLDDLFANTHLPADAVVYRGISRAMGSVLDKAIANSQGIFLDKGFVSTTSSERFASSWKDKYVTIELPKGSPALDVREWSSHPEEHETLLARGQTYAARRDPADKNHYFIRLVPNVGKASMRLIKRREADRAHPNDKFVWDASHVIFLTKKYNPNHDAQGRFAEGSGSGAEPKPSGGFKLTAEYLPLGYTTKPNFGGGGGADVLNAEGLSVTHGSTVQQAVTNYFNSHPDDPLPEGYKYVSGNILDTSGNVVFTQIDPSQKESQVVEDFLNSPKSPNYFSSNSGVFIQGSVNVGSADKPGGLPPGYTAKPNTGGGASYAGWFTVTDPQGKPLGQASSMEDAISLAQNHAGTAWSTSAASSSTPFVPGEEHLPDGVQLKDNQAGWDSFKVVSATGEVLGGGNTAKEALDEYYTYHPNVLLPDGYKTSYASVGNVTTITDPAGKEVFESQPGQNTYTAVTSFLGQNPSLAPSKPEDVASLADLPESMRFGSGAGGGPEALGTAGLPPGFNQSGQRGAEVAPGEVAPPSVHQITSDEKQAIYSYTGSGNSALNKYLRDNITPDHPVTVKQNMQNLDAVFSDTATAKPITLYRGISQKAQDKLDYAIAHTDGHFVDPGFVSTSSDEGTARTWKSGTYVTIAVPAGSKALDVEHPKTLTSHPGESEWIIARDQHFTVSKDTRASPYGYHGDHYFLTLMNKSPAPKDTRQIELPFVDHGPVNKQEEPYDPSDKFTWDESGIVPTDPAELEKFNPWHDLMGLFTSGPSGGASVGEHGTTGSTAASTTTVNEMLAPHITPEQRNSVAYYTDEGYLGINQYLRYGKEPASSNTPFFSDNSGVEEAQSTIQHLDEILAHSSLPQETTVFRGLSPRAADRMDAALAAGDSRFVDKGFISTTASEHYAEVFASRMMQNHAIAEIVLPKGSHARDVSSWSSSPDERETLVARGSAFKVERVERLPAGPRYHLRLLPEYSPNQMDLPLGKQMNTGDKYTWNGDEMEFFAEKFNPNHDELGRFASGPGGGLEGYSADSKLVDGKLHTSNIDDALKALAANREVVLDQPHQVSTLLDRLAAMAKDAAAKGEKAPKYDLCNVSVSGTNLFCGGSLGIPRVKMPQLAGVPLPGSKADALPKDAKGRADLGTLFKQHLADMGHSIVDDTVDASHLRASQDQLDGARVARAYERIRAGEMPPPTFISKDDYIVDGHHRWAGAVGAKYTGTRAHAMPLKVERVDMGIVPLLKEARRFGKEWGMPQVAKFNQSHDELGRFSSGDSSGDGGFKAGDTVWHYNYGTGKVESVSRNKELAIVDFGGGLRAPIQMDELQAKDPKTQMVLSPEEEAAYQASNTPEAVLAAWKRDGNDIVAYHGTSQYVLPSIMKEGLHATKQKTYDFGGGKGEIDYYKGDRGQSVFVTDNKDRALRFARDAAGLGAEPVALELHIPKDQWTKFKADEEVTGARSAYAPVTIPPEWITRVYGEHWSKSPSLFKADDVVRYAIIFVSKPVEKFNPNHDELGRFSSSDEGSAGLDMAIAGALKDKGGFTFNPVTVKSPKHGYAVGGYGTRDAYDAKTFVLNNVKEYLAKNRAALNDGNFLGGWIDKGKVYLDVTKVFPETQREAAIAAGREHDQIAIADLWALNSGHMDRAFIDTGGTGKAEPGKRTMFLLDPSQMSEEEMYGALAAMIKQTTT